jgi:hypothetical protein
VIDEREREIIIKEARLAALHDLEAVLRDLRAGKLVKGGVTEEARGALDIIMFYLAQRVRDVAQDKADRQRLVHTPWEEQGGGSGG